MADVNPEEFLSGEVTVNDVEKTAENIVQLANKIECRGVDWTSEGHIGEVYWNSIAGRTRQIVREHCDV